MILPADEVLHEGGRLGPLPRSGAQRRGAAPPRRRRPPRGGVEQVLLPSWDEARRALDGEGLLEQRLIGRLGFCSVCAKDLVEQARQLTPTRGRKAPPLHFRWPVR
ncbi:MAG: hypothetical protein ACREQM_18230 [Candidatus Dormibacteraceae bacterium]